MNNRPESRIDTIDSTVTTDTDCLAGLDATIAKLETILARYPK